MRVDVREPLEAVAGDALQHPADVVAVEAVGVGLLEQQPDHPAEDEAGLVGRREPGHGLVVRLPVASPYGGDGLGGAHRDLAGGGGQVAPGGGHGASIPDGSDSGREWASSPRGTTLGVAGGNPVAGRHTLGRECLA